MKAGIDLLVAGDVMVRKRVRAEATLEEELA